MITNCEERHHVVGKEGTVAVKLAQMAYIARQLCLPDAKLNTDVRLAELHGLFRGYWSKMTSISSRMPCSSSTTHYWHWADARYGLPSLRRSLAIEMSADKLYFKFV
jgi:hypothetical protein